METGTRLTVKELFETYPEESRVELIEGEVYEMPAPNFLHQEVLFRLAIRLRTYAEERALGTVVIAPIDVVFDEETVLKPDAVYVSDLSKIGNYGSPDLVVEVVSPSTFKRDFVDKTRLYERFGVKEYWLVFPLEKTIMVYELKDKGY